LLSTATAPTTSKDDKPVAPGADLTVASVRQHIKQRLTAAKEQCDTTLRRIIATIQLFEEERMMAADVIEDQRRDYFDTFSDSPVIDAADSEDEQSIPPLGGCTYICERAAS
jgi:serine/threonine-protein kinase RIM15